MRRETLFLPFSALQGFPAVVVLPCSSSRSLLAAQWLSAVKEYLSLASAAVSDCAFEEL